MSEPELPEDPFFTRAKELLTKQKYTAQDNLWTKRNMTVRLCLRKTQNGDRSFCQAELTATTIVRFILLGGVYAVRTGETTWKRPEDEFWIEFEDKISCA